MRSMALADWEQPLVERARAALDYFRVPNALAVDSLKLHRAYQACEDVIRQHSRSFYWASMLLPPPKRRAIRALYAFCRIADNTVDTPVGDPESQLAEWRRIALSDRPPEDQLVAVAWADVRTRYRIPVLYAEQLLDAIARDLRPTRYETFEELAEYCYGVASTVGLMSMHIIGFSGPEIIPYAIRLGIAMQLTNILRDVGEDWRRGRLYLPLAELRAFGLSVEDIAAERVNPRWRNFMRFQIARVRSLYEEALPGIAGLHPDGRLSVAAAAELYRAILDDIEAHDYDTFCRRARISRPTMLKCVLRAWRRTQTGFYGADHRGA